MTEKRQPWLKWYPSDWRADPGLRMCSFAARGLWADLLGIMHEADPYGHLLVNGRQPSHEDLATMLGGSVKQIAALLSKLAAAGVFSMTEEGVIYSRRMLRDKEKAEIDKKNGKGGGNPKLRASDNQGVNPHDNHYDKTPDKAQKPEARSQIPESLPLATLEGGARATKSEITIAKGEKNGRGTRLAADWQPSSEDREFAQALGLDPDRIAAKFRDFWFAKAGPDGVKRDWSATWRNWCRRDAEGGSGGGVAPRGNPPDRQGGGGVIASGLAVLARRTGQS